MFMLYIDKIIHVTMLHPWISVVLTSYHGQSVADFSHFLIGGQKESLARQLIHIIATACNTGLDINIP